MAPTPQLGLALPQRRLAPVLQVRDWYFIAEQPAPSPHLAHPDGCAALRIVLVTVPRASRSCEHFPDGFDRRLAPVRQVTLHPEP